MTGSRTQQKLQKVSDLPHVCGFDILDSFPFKQFQARGLDFLCKRFFVRRPSSGVTLRIVQKNTTESPEHSSLQGSLIHSASERPPRRPPASYSAGSTPVARDAYASRSRGSTEAPRHTPDPGGGVLMNPRGALITAHPLAAKHLQKPYPDRCLLLVPVGYYNAPCCGRRTLVAASGTRFSKFGTRALVAASGTRVSDPKGASRLSDLHVGRASRVSDLRCGHRIYTKTCQVQR